ncbi:M14 family metallopeptidase [Ideonella sp. A 288]|uniref:M14 family metallopeptidase n=1 Tax=Ideonella sp. A 288 TaxID=1962181 RepID=UPI001F272A4C|nr:M14 family metallopeptidase [Ideonella sp. A 288]
MPFDPIADAFSPDHASARQRWLALVAARGLAVESHPHPLRGPAGEVLAVDVVRDGPADAAKVLLTTSGVHGVEGHAGCGIQAGLLALGASLREAADADTAIVHVHAVNPHGFAFTRRVTHENVDLNRNFVDFGQPLPEHPDYAAIESLLLPPTWPPTPDNEAALAARLDAMGPRRAQMAVTRGQHTRPMGLYYGGREPTWSHRVFREVLRRHAGTCRRLAWIDLHTGLGPAGVGERIFASHDAGAALARARRWWGEGVTSVHTGTSTSIPMTGPIQQAVDGECPQAEYTGICLEFGTVPLPQMMAALRADHWLHAHPEADAALARQIRRDLRDAFYTDTDAWKRQVWAQGLDATRQALHGLRQPG